MIGVGEREKRKQFIESLSPKERGIFADMIMRSLRGSWSNPRERTYMLEWVGKTDDVEYYSPEKLRDRVKSYFELIGRGSPDGRFWRSYYQEANVDVTELSEPEVRELSSHIPDDRTWDDARIRKEFDIYE